MADMAQLKSSEFDDKVIRKIEYWKSSLLDTGKRNKMINFKDSKRSSLSILEPETTSLFNEFAFLDKSLTIQMPIDKGTDRRTYAIIELMDHLSYDLNVLEGDIKTLGTVSERNKTLANLRSKAKLAMEEQGINILYLCFGFIYWKERDKGNVLKSPLLLMPIKISQKSLNAPYAISKYDDDTVVNPTLSFRLQKDFNIVLPEFKLQNNESFDDYMSEIEKTVDSRGWKLTREMSIGLLDFLKISMYHDLDKYQERIAGHSVIRAMAGDVESFEKIPAETSDFDFDSLRPGEWHEVVNADSSQEEAILLLKSGTSFVMQGPPGTGKRQTITNIIAEALADGKKVLFVSEKAAALQVVLKRLTEVGLDDFCLSLHSYKAKIKDIIESIGRNLNLQVAHKYESSFSEMTVLFNDRKYLNEYADELHKIIAPLNRSLYMVIGEMTKLKNAFDIDFSLSGLSDMTNERLLSLQSYVSAFETALHNMGGKISQNPWYNTTVTSSGQEYSGKLLRNTSGLSENLRKIAELSEIIAADLGIVIGDSFNDVKRLFSVSDILVKHPLVMCRPMFDHKNYSFNEKILNDARMHSKKLREIKSEVESIWDSSVYSLDYNDLGDYFSKDDSWIFHTNKTGSDEQCLENAAVKAGLLKQQTESLLTEYRKGARLIDFSGKETIDNIRLVSKVLKLIADAPYMETEWFGLRRHTEAMSCVSSAVEHSNKINSVTETVFCDWDDSVYNIDDSVFLRYKSVYSEGFIESVHMYDDDIKMLSQYAKNIDIMSDRDGIVNSLGNIAACNNCKEKFSQFNTLLSELFGDIYNGIDTDWELITHYLNKAKRISEAESLISETIQRINNISDKKAQITAEWEASVYDIDADAMLDRFKTKYDDRFYSIMSSFTDDMNHLRICAIKPGIENDESCVPDLLRRLKKINEEQKWLYDNKSKWDVILDSDYITDNIDWSEAEQKVKSGRKLYESSDIIIAAEQYAESIRKISAELFEKCSSTILDVDPDMLTRFCSDYSDEFIERDSKYRNDIDTLSKSIKSTELLSDKDHIIHILEKISAVKMHNEWFDENNSVISSLLEGKYSGIDSDWEAIECLNEALIINESESFIIEAVNNGMSITAKKEEIMTEWE